jgi:hypothetical protein
MHPAVEAEIDKCAQDFWYFCTTYLKIRDKQDNLIPLIPNRAQRIILETLWTHNRVYILKARQMGATTIVWAWRFWKWMFKPNYEGLTTAHREKDAIKIFKVPRRFYAHLPPYLRKHGFKLARDNTQEMESARGAYIGCQTVGTGVSEEQDRGGTLSDLHCTEFAFYKNVAGTMAGLFQQVGKSPIVLETTANSLNEAHAMWVRQDGYKKLFLTWTLDDGYQMDEAPALFTPEWEYYGAWKQYQKLWGITDKQLNWAVDTFINECNLSWDLFNQEYPISPELAFITSGQRFFNRVYPHVEALDGYLEFAEPQVGRTYSMGVDAASGAPDGDKQAASVFDVTDEGAPTKVASIYCQVDLKTFGAWCLWLAQRYKCTATVERNASGQSVIEDMTDGGHTLMYREERKDRLTGKPKEVFGRATTDASRLAMFGALQKLVNSGKYHPNDPRMQAEVNTFVYGDDGKPAAAGKRKGNRKAAAGVDAGSRCYDDMVTSEALAWAGRGQALPFTGAVGPDPEPTSLAEKMQWEVRHGQRWGEPGSHQRSVSRGKNPTAHLRNRRRSV